MTPEEAKDKMEEMARNVSGFWLPEGFKVAVYVPKEIADLAMQYYDGTHPFGYRNGFAAGESFYYKGIKCFAEPKHWKE